jgi:hypothetical protein
VVGPSQDRATNSSDVEVDATKNIGLAVVVCGVYDTITASYWKVILVILEVSIVLAPVYPPDRRLAKCVLSFFLWFVLGLKTSVRLSLGECGGTVGTADGCTSQIYEVLDESTLLSFCNRHIHWYIPGWHVGSLSCPA